MSSIVADHLVYKFYSSQVIASRVMDYKDFIRKCRSLFEDIPENVPLKLYTDELEFMHGTLVEISVESFIDVVPQTKSVIIMVDVDIMIFDDALVERRKEKFRLRVHYFIHGFNSWAQFAVSPRTKTRRIAAELAKKMGVRMSELILAYNGESLQLEKSLKENGISTGAVLFCIRISEGDREVAIENQVDSPEATSVPST
ncbi:hypothetical protein CVT26_007530 [Gymnopilus dilepis]|uniref:Rad60/SUMO-like domain-containing protein n=1 Tax=Gymnopilus dilepis TaxID=231916 RepID=A0A409W879_9AGAR|nr:hypothetical protein CVT26_007530 [Gymnopilus dilepis]